MPIFDFACKNCGKTFDLMISNKEKENARCPECGSAELKQLLSPFGTTTKVAASPTNNGCAGCCAAGKCGLNF